MKHFLTGAVAGAAAASLCLLAVLTNAPAGAAPTAARHTHAVRDSPPECNTVGVVAPNGKVAYVVGCGGGASTESPWQDAANHEQVIMDGIRSITPANCPKANPCVLIWENAPPS
jgi:hypothetical protein